MDLFLRVIFVPTDKIHLGILVQELDVDQLSVQTSYRYRPVIDIDQL